MIAKTLSDIGNVAIYPVLTLVIFFSIFAVMLIMVLRGNKAQYAKMAAMPLEEGQTKVSAPAAGPIARTP